MSNYKIPLERIEKFLHGHDDEKFIVNLEYDASTNTIYKIKEVPETGRKVIETDTLKSFIWIKNLNEIKKIRRFYGGNDVAIKKAREEYGIDIKALRHDDNLRLFNGFKYLVTCNQGHNKLIEFFKNGGIFPYDKRDNVSDHFMILKPIEQYLIGTGKRLFKGFEEYKDIHKLVFDLETTGLDPKTERIFLIGAKDNRGFEHLLETDLTDEGETRAILSFFAIIDHIKPSIIGGYNSANFDWDFIFTRCEILGIPIEKYAKTLKEGELINRAKSTLKLGGEVEDYDQVNMFGYNIVDIIHSARRAQAIDSDMQSASLKYVCKYNKIAKKNRVYVIGDKIGHIYQDTDKYYFDDRSGAYCKTRPKVEYMDYITRDVMRANPDKIFIFGDNDERVGMGGQAKEMRGEPNVIGIRTKGKASHNEDAYYTDATFEQNKQKILLDLKLVMDQMKKGKTIVIPSAGIGTGLAQLSTRAPRTLEFIKGMLAQLQPYADSFVETDGKYIVKRYLMDDLWETMEVDNIYNQTGFMLGSMIPTTYQRILTMGTAGLWKMLMQTWSYENGLAVPIPDQRREFVGGLSRLLMTGFSTVLRKMDFNSLYPAIQLAHDVFPDVDIDGAMKSMLKYFHSERFKAKDLSDKLKKTDPTKSAFYKRKQLPLKIFINSMFGALGAPQAFPWAEINVSERVTCIARQYLRLMVRFFMNRGYTPLVLDTDGVNFMAPPIGDDHFEYIGKGYHPEVEEGKLYKGIKAVAAEFNDTFMKGEMGLGLDGEWPSTINLARKNYAVMEADGSVKKTGNSIKSKKMPVYIEEFLDKGIKMLLTGKGPDFVNYYNEYVEKIARMQIPLAKIATKARVKKTIETYQNRGTNINGATLPKQAHMELAIQDNVKVNLGDVLYYVNVGNKKSATDVGFDSDGTPYSRLIDAKLIENDPNTIGEYNVPRYLSMFNKRIEPLLVCFDKEIRDKILITDPFPKPKKEKKKTKKELKEMAKFLTDNGWHMLWDNLDSWVTNETLKSPGFDANHMGGISLEYAWKIANNIPEEPTDTNRPIQKNSFMLCELNLVNGQPFEDGDQDSIEELFTPSEMEIDHWNRIGYDPTFWNDPTPVFTVPGLGFERIVA